MTTLTANLADRPRMSTFNQATLSLYWFGTSVLWTVVLITTLPSQALLIGGDSVKGLTLGVVLFVGAFVSMLVAPIFGAISDRTVTRFGRRRPWIVIGTVMSLFGLLGLAYLPRANDLSSLPFYILAFMWVEFWNNVATAPYSALIPDVVPADQRGSAFRLVWLDEHSGCVCRRTGTLSLYHERRNEYYGLVLFCRRRLAIWHVGHRHLCQRTKSDQASTAL